MTESRTRVLLLGAYGFFGSRIAAGLAHNPRVQLILAGRDSTKATALAYQLGLSADSARRVDASNAIASSSTRAIRAWHCCFASSA